MSEESEVLKTDEKNELYGYGIMNVGQNSMISLSPYTDTRGSNFENEVVVSGKEKILEAYKNFAEDHIERTGSSNLSSFRVVEVRLSNQLDNDAIEKVKEEVKE